MMQWTESKMSSIVDSSLCIGKLRQCLFSSLLEKTIFHIKFADFQDLHEACPHLLTQI
jgi:hypothetical protein